MRVEVDVSDLVDGAYFIDEKCEELEAILRKDLKYAECKVKRRHMGEGEWKLDPFVIQNSKREDLTTLETWEVSALDDSEILSYTDVQIDRELCDYSGSALLFTIILILLGPMAITFSVLGVSLYSSSVNQIIAVLAVVLDLLVLLSGVSLYRRRKEGKSRKRHIDLVAAREDSTFLNALRKLVELSDQENWKRDEYVKRLGYIENALTGFDS